MSSTASPDANTSARYDPKVRRPVVSGRAAMRVATSAAPRATTSAAMWPASLSSDSDPLASAETSSTTKKAAMSANATRRRQRWVAPALG